MTDKVAAREQRWITTYEGAGAYWVYSGNPKDYHASLTSGKCSTGYFDSRPISASDNLLSRAARELIDMLLEDGLNIALVDGVVGPQTGATRLAEFLSKEITRRTGKPCFFVSPAKGLLEGVKVMVFTDEDRARVKGKNLLSCDDVFTTGGSVGMAIYAVEEAGGFVLPWTTGFVNRSGFTYLRGKQLYVLVTMRIETWESDECPLCKTGSPFIKPKAEPGNWAILTARSVKRQERLT